MEHPTFNEDLMQSLEENNIIVESRSENVASDNIPINRSQHVRWQINNSHITLKMAWYMAHVITRIHDGEAVAAVAQDIGIPEALLRAWYKSRKTRIADLKTLSTTEMIQKLFKYNNTSSSPAANVSECNALNVQHAQTNHAPNGGLKIKKRSSKLMTAEKKLSAIERIENGECKTAVAHSIDIAESIFHDWCKLEEKFSIKVLRYLEYLTHSITVPPSDRDIAPPPPAAAMQINAENTVHVVRKTFKEEFSRKLARIEPEAMSTATTSRRNTARLAAPYHDKIRSLLAKNPALMNLVYFDSEGYLRLNFLTSVQPALQALFHLAILNNESISPGVSGSPENNLH